MEQIENNAWDNNSYEEKNRILYEQQKNTLNMFFERGAITKQQFDIGNEHLNNMCRSDFSLKE